MGKAKFDLQNETISFVMEMTNAVEWYRQEHSHTYRKLKETRDDAFIDESEMDSVEEKLFNAYTLKFHEWEGAILDYSCTQGVVAAVGEYLAPNYWNGKSLMDLCRMPDSSNYEDRLQVALKAVVPAFPDQDFKAYHESSQKMVMSSRKHAFVYGYAWMQEVLKNIGHKPNQSRLTELYKELD